MRAEEIKGLSPELILRRMIEEELMNAEISILNNQTQDSVCIRIDMHFSADLGRNFLVACKPVDAKWLVREALIKQNQDTNTELNQLRRMRDALRIIGGVMNKEA